MTLTEEQDALTETVVLGRYRLGRRLGAGGFGAVHEAVDERLHRWVAVKVLHAEGAAPERARREAIAAARLDHPGIVAVFDAGEEDGARYLVSELVDGRTMSALEAGDELSDRDVLRVGLSLCDALEHAHERGVVHRDVKPQNVLVPDRPRSWREAAKLADFGVAMLAGDEPLTVTGDVVGTLAYMAPEQASGKRVDERADIYAVALVLYEALAGHNPVRGASPAETARRVGRQIVPLQRVRPDLPGALCAAIDVALRPEPSQRGTLEQLADALEDAITDVGDEGGTIARHPVERPSLLPPVPRGAPRALNALATGALVAAALTTLAGIPAGQSAAAGLAAAALVALLPRAGWLLAALGTLLGLLTGPALASADGRVAAGAALLVTAGVVPVPLLLARRPLQWSAPALAPLLAVAGLATAFPALAGRAGRLPERIALAAAGAWWLLLAEIATGRTFLLGPPPDSPLGEQARDAVSLAARAIGDAVSSGLPLLLVVWAAAAAVLPWIVRGRILALDVVAATGWAAGLAAATGALATALALPQPRGLVAGAVVAGAAAVVAAREPRYWTGDDPA